MIRAALLLALALLPPLVSPAMAATPHRLFLDDLTSPELRAAISGGATTVIIPVGGTEQSGPNIALGKHNVRVRVLAERIAAELGNALVAPVVAYVPEGSITPAQGHMRFAGTISIPDDAFKAMLAGAARSLVHGGFTDVVLIGDHGGYQNLLEGVAAQLNHEWAKLPGAATLPRAHFVAEYYLAAQAPFNQALRAHGLSEAQIGLHAGAADTALMLATDATLVRADQLTSAAQGAPANGVVGDPRPATAALGRLGTEPIVTATVAAIRRAVSARH